MTLIQNISSTLKFLDFKSQLRAWIFKKKLLRFSGRFRWEPEACFYCPEMCRFACPTAETLRVNTVTPRGKMSLLHLAERGYKAEQIAGSEADRLWFLEQCTGCGRCTEYCVYEVDVASNLRAARAEQLGREAVAAQKDYVDARALRATLDELRGLKGVVLLCEPGRKEWWTARPRLLRELGVSAVSDAALPHREWSWGKLADLQTEAVGEALSGCQQLWVESPEAGWFLAKGVKEEREALGAEVRVVWQRFFADFASREIPPGTSLHESWNLTRSFPRLDYSMPMYERGLLPFHHGWNVHDCGGEGHYKLANPAAAAEMGHRYLRDLRNDGRAVDKIICQSLSCVAHLRGLTDAQVVYWLDELEGSA